MKTLAKPWVKFLISIVSGGVISELISIRSGQDAPGYIFIVGAVLMYVFISAVIFWFNWKQSKDS